MKMKLLAVLMIVSLEARDDDERKKERAHEAQHRAHEAPRHAETHNAPQRPHAEVHNVPAAPRQNVEVHRETPRQNVEAHRAHEVVRRGENRNPFSNAPSMSRAVFTRPNAARGGQPTSMQNFFRENHPQNRRSSHRAINNTNFGNNVRNDFRGSGLNRNNDWFGGNFWRGHHHHPRYWKARRNWWGWGTPTLISNWVGWGGAPIYYDYGYGYGYDSGYYNYNYAPTNIQTTYVQAGASEGTEDWLPLGVFALTNQGNEDITPNIYLQIALSRDGTIAGTLYNSTTDATYAIAGMADQSTQVAAWQISDIPNSPLFETGLYNLAQSETPVQIHFADGSMQVMQLVRLEGQEGGPTDLLDNVL
jgi:hypothetical protein